MEGQDGGEGRIDNDNVLCHLHFQNSKFKTLIFPAPQTFTSCLCLQGVAHRRLVCNSKLLATTVPSKRVWHEGWKKFLSDFSCFDCLLAPRSLKVSLTLVLFLS